jgi:hypothetical protein
VARRRHSLPPLGPRQARHQRPRRPGPAHPDRKTTQKPTTPARHRAHRRDRPMILLFAANCRSSRTAAGPGSGTRSRLSATRIAASRQLTRGLSGPMTRRCIGQVDMASRPRLVPADPPSGQHRGNRDASKAPRGSSVARRGEDWSAERRRKGCRKTLRAPQRSAACVGRSFTANPSFGICGVYPTKTVGAGRQSGPHEPEEAP